MPVEETRIDDSFEAYRNYLLMVARGMMGISYRGKVDAEELVNESLFEAYQQRENFRGTTGAECIAWLRKILTDNINDAIRFFHRDKRDVNKEQRLAAADWDQSCSHLFDITCGLTSPSLNAVKHEQELQLAGALAQLPENQRTAIECHHLHGCSLAETADALECSVPAVAGLLRRGLKQLRESLQTKSEFK
jgi:RNA polymerase sigma-70 factor (ECF subfamily)